MTQRRYDQPCSLAQALDRIGERWSLLIVRELMLGPLRFSDLARAVGGPPTDVLTKRLRALQDDGVVARRQLGPPASATVYELTDLGRELEQPLIALARWGMNFLTAEVAAELPPSLAMNALQVIVQPDPAAALTVQLNADGEPFRLRIADGRARVARGDADDPALTLSGSPGNILGTIAEPGWPGVEVAGDGDALRLLQTMVVMPDRLREEIAAVAAAAA